MPIRKVDVSVDSLIAKGIIWEWNAGRDLWIAFREDANALIEKEFGTNGKKKSWRNPSKPLNLAIIGLPYKIDVIKLCQKNIHSGRERKIRRQIYSSYLNILPTVDVEVDQLQLSTISQQQTLG